MKTLQLTLAVLIFSAGLLLASCAVPPSVTPPVPISVTLPAVPIPTLTETSTPAASTTSISAVTWSPGDRLIAIDLDPWPAAWPGWTLYVDGLEVPMEGVEGNPVVRPNAPLDQPPDGLIVGTLPWATGLDRVDFPCCGALQFAIPGEGLTNNFAFNLADQGCATASTKECPSEWTVHEGDLIVAGSETRQIDHLKLLQKGNIYVRDSATLEITHSELLIARGETPTIHVYIFVDPAATLIIDHSKIDAPEGDGLVCVFNYGETRLSDSPTAIHYFDMSSGARLSMENSEMVNPIGGLLQVTGGSTRVTGSTLGAIGLNVPAGAHLDIAGLTSGMHFDDWDVHTLIPEADYDLVLQDTTVLADDLTGVLEHGPYERGWIFFLDPDAHVRLSDSELRKVFLDLKNETVTFQDLQIGVPSSLAYRDIVLTDVVVEGEWPFTIQDSDVTLVNSNYLFLQPQGASTLRLIDSHIVEFIPRDFSGTIIFENGLWNTAGEILGGVDYHSDSNDFTIRGSLKLGDELRTNLQWQDARVTREFDVVLADARGDPLGGRVIRVAGQEVVVDTEGKAVFSIVFDDANYNQPTPLDVWQSGQLIASLAIDFFTETPVRISVEG